MLDGQELRTFYTERFAFEFCEVVESPKGLEAQTRRKRAPGNGSMEVCGTSPTGQVNLSSNQTE